MARILMSGAELNEHLTLVPTNPDGSFQDSSNFITNQTGVVRSGSRAWKFTSVGSGSAGHGFGITPGSGVTSFFRVFMRFENLPSATTGVVALGTSLASSSGTGTVSCRLTSTGVFQLWNDGGGTQIGADSAAITAGDAIWHRLELAYRNSTASNGYAELMVDGVSVASTNTHVITALMTAANVGFNNGPWASGAIVYYDDIAINDSSGASQNSWPGDGKVVLHVPISDSAVGTGWTLGTGTAIAGGSGSTAVKNTPPLGVADLAAGSDTKQIRNATSNANVNYDATLTTYTNAGIGASDTINVLLPIVATGAPVVTSAKAGTVGVASNPTIANVSLGAAGTAGAFWQGVAAGTYPTGWKWSSGTATYNPTVTKGNSPVARITQVTASTRIAMVCWLGMYADYTPAATVNPPKPTVIMQAINRSASW